MKNLIILGAGTAGTMVANHIQGKLPSGWRLTVIDPSSTHLYQPGLLFLPFGARDEAKIQRPRRRTLASGVRWLPEAVQEVDPKARQVVLETGDRLSYDLLLIASGSQIRPEETEGLAGEEWGLSIHDFYTLEGALKLREALASFEGGRLVLNVVEMPIKCPVAPLEFLFLADAFFTERGIRDQVELVYATPLDGAFTKPVAAHALGSMLQEKGIAVEAEFNTGEVDAAARKLRSWDEREVPYDLLVSIPTHMGASFIGASGLGNELDFVPTDPHSLVSKNHDEIFVMGDATDLPSSKAGSVAHFQSEVVSENLLRTMAGRSLVDTFDGHSNCFIESGHGKALLIDFNYDVQPLPGRFPVPVVGPFSLLAESRINHWGKLGFRWIYWNALLPARPLPFPHRMTMAGKDTSLLQASA
ncbi:MAG: FAD/NAD(P)-binding oxidoreductase [Acidobacteriota bacterium]|nr:FAD/NAD(P)-binding oxidoreductase [Acidobacteriota bacterium]